MPYPELKALLTDIGTEELGHLEMIGSIVHQLTRKLTDSQIEESGFMPYFVDHTAGIYPTAASGSPWNAAGIGVKGDPIADLTEDLAAEQKARVTYDNILRLSDDPDVNDVIRFLRERGNCPLPALWRGHRPAAPAPQREKRLRHQPGAGFLTPSIGRLPLLSKGRHIFQAYPRSRRVYLKAGTA